MFIMHNLLVIELSQFPEKKHSLPKGERTSSQQFPLIRSKDQHRDCRQSQPASGSVSTRWSPIIPGCGTTPSIATPNCCRDSGIDLSSQTIPARLAHKRHLNFTPKLRSSAQITPATGTFWPGKTMLDTDPTEFPVPVTVIAELPLIPHQKSNNLFRVRLSLFLGAFVGVPGSIPHRLARAKP